MTNEMDSRTTTQRWTKELTETINNISRQCLDRLAKLESENKELKEQYKHLEDQITPLVKSLNTHEQMLSGKGLENGDKDFVPGGLNANWREFDAQIRQLISILVHTNVAQNDIREDCRYLKHRVSHLEQANLHLYSMIRQRYPELALSNTEHESQSSNRLIEGTHPKPVCSSQTVVKSHPQESALNDFPNDLSSPILPLALPLRGDGDGGSDATVDCRQPCCCFRRRNTIQMCPDLKPSIEDTFLEHYVGPIIERTLLRTASTPLIPLPAMGYGHMSFFPQSSQPNRPSSDRLHRPLEALDDTHSPHDSPKSPSCRHRRTQQAAVSSRPTTLVPNGWLKMSVLPNTATCDRQPIGTKSHIFLGARSLPLCLKNDPPNKALTDSERDSDQDRIGRQNRNYGHLLNPIEEVDSCLQSFYELPNDGSAVISPSAGRLIDQNIELKHDGSNSLSPDWTTMSLDQPIVLFRDPKHRYLYPLKSAQNFLPTVTVGGATPHSLKPHRTLDLESLLYQHEQLQKCREARRNMRHAVFSDTELLTGKFTITSTDDSEVESGQDDDDEDEEEEEELEDFPSSKEESIKASTNDLVLVDSHWVFNEPSAVVPNSSDTISTSVSTDDEAAAPVLITVSDEGNRRSLEIEQMVEAVSIHAPQSPKEKTEEEIEADDNHSTYKNRFTSSPEPSKSDDFNYETDQIRGSAPPPVVIHRRRFGVSECNEQNTLKRRNTKTSEKEIDKSCNSHHEPEQSTTPGHITPELHSSDTDSCTFTSDSHNTPTRPDSNESAIMDLSEGSSTSPIEQSTVASEKDEPEPQTQDQNLKRIDSTSTLTNMKRSELSNTGQREGVKTSDQSHSSMIDQKPLKSTTIIHGRSKVYKTTADTTRVNNSKNIGLSVRDDVKSVNHGTMAVGQVNSSPRQLTHRPSTSPQTRRVIDYFDNNSSCRQRPDSVKNSPSRLAAPNSYVPILSRSSPNSPDHSSTNAMRYRAHLTPSVMRASEQTSLTAMTSRSDKPNSPTSVLRNRQSNDDAWLYSSPVRRQYSPTKRHGNQSPNRRPSVSPQPSLSSKSGISPPPIPPRTSSRTQSYQTRQSFQPTDSTTFYYEAIPTPLSPLARPAIPEPVTTASWRETGHSYRTLLTRPQSTTPQQLSPQRSGVNSAVGLRSNKKRVHIQDAKTVDSTPLHTRLQPVQTPKPSPTLQGVSGKRESPASMLYNHKSPRRLPPTMMSNDPMQYYATKENYDLPELRRLPEPVEFSYTTSTTASPNRQSRVSLSPSQGRSSPQSRYNTNGLSPAWPRCLTSAVRWDPAEHDYAHAASADGNYPWSTSPSSTTAIEHTRGQKVGSRPPVRYNPSTYSKEQQAI